MTRIFSRIDKTYWILVPVILHESWPWLSLHLRTRVPFFLFLLWFLVVPKKFYPMKEGKQLDRAFIQVFFFWFCLSFLKSFFALAGHGDFTLYHEFATCLSQFLHFVVLYISIRARKHRELAFLAFWTLLGFSLSIVANIQSMSTGMEGGRALATHLNKHDTMEAAFAMVSAAEMGLAGYGMSYLFALMLPALIWAGITARGMVQRAFFFFAAFSTSWMLRDGGLATPVFVAAYGLGLLLLYLVRIRKRWIVLFGLGGGILLIVFAFSPNTFSILLKPMAWAAQLFPEGGSINSRLLSISDGIGGDFSAYGVARYELQAMSARVFLAHPFFGVGMYYFPHPIFDEIGGHSQLLDLAAMSGLIGVTLFVAFLFAIRRFFIILLNELEWHDGLLAVVDIYLCSYVFLAIANPIPTLPWGIYAIPGMAILSVQFGNRNIPFTLKMQTQQYKKR